MIVLDTNVVPGKRLLGQVDRMLREDFTRRILPFDSD